MSDADLDRALYQVEQRRLSGLVAGGARQAALLGPTTVAVHDHRDMLWDERRWDSRCPSPAGVRARRSDLAARSHAAGSTKTARAPLISQPHAADAHRRDGRLDGARGVDRAQMDRHQPQSAANVERQCVEVVVGGDQPQAPAGLPVGLLDGGFQQGPADALPPLDGVDRDNLEGAALHLVGQQAHWLVVDRGHVARAAGPRRARRRG